MSLLSSLPPERQRLITRHLELVLEANESVNLTRIDDYQDALLLHIEDSLTALEELNAAPEGLYGDIGSGAGYPGIPLAIASERETVLIDARQKKMQLVNEMIEELGLSNQIRTYAGRAELLARMQPDSFAVITARAVAQLPVLMELASPLLVRKGRLICYKAHIDEEELGRARRVQSTVGMRMISIRELKLGEEFTRTIVTCEKVANPSVNLPRREGEAQKNPLN